MHIVMVDHSNHFLFCDHEKRAFSFDLVIYFVLYFVIWFLMFQRSDATSERGPCPS